MFPLFLVGCSSSIWELPRPELLRGPQYYNPAAILRVELDRNNHHKIDTRLFVSDSTTRAVQGNMDLSRLHDLLESKQFENALVCLESAREQCAPDLLGDLYLWESVVLYSRGDYLLALENIEKSIIAQPECWRGYFHKYYVLTKLGEDVSVTRSKVLELNPSAPLSLYRADATEGVVI